MAINRATRRAMQAGPMTINAKKVIDNDTPEHRCGDRRILYTLAPEHTPVTRRLPANIAGRRR
jgi:hypothetical protein